MSFPEISHDPFERPNLSPFEHTSSPNLTAGRIYQNALTSGSAQAHYGDCIMYGDSHIHHHCKTLHFVALADLKRVVPFHEAARSPPPRKPTNTLRWRKDPHFVGREETLASIKQILEQYGCVALTGAGGVGFVLTEFRAYLSQASDNLAKQITDSHRILLATA